LLEKSYPALYRNAGIGGKAVLWVVIDEAGAVRNTRVVTSTGFPELDDVAERILRDRAHFTPAYNRDQRVPVWIQIPVEVSATARSRDPGPQTESAGRVQGPAVSPGRSGGGSRTRDHRVMSPTSYQAAPPRDRVAEHDEEIV